MRHWRTNVLRIVRFVNTHFQRLVRTLDTASQGNIRRVWLAQSQTPSFQQETIQGISGALLVSAGTVA